MDDPEILKKISPYIKIAYKHTSVDWNISPGGKFTSVYVPARMCIREDFGSHSKGDEILTDWEGYSLICPDLSSLDGGTWMFTGDASSFISERGEFVIERCKEESYCKNDEEINKFVSDLQVDTWVF